MGNGALGIRALLAAPLAVAICVAAASCARERRGVSCVTCDAGDAATVLCSASQVVAAFKASNGAQLASLVHPTKGVRFSCYAWVDVDHDVRLSRAQVRRFWADETAYLWGSADGTGDPIQMTPREYCLTYVLDRDFTRPSSISVNSDRRYGNTSNNAASTYPDSMRVEYYIAATPGVEMDWVALRLVFERRGRSWYLVGVMHDQWTI